MQILVVGGTWHIGSYLVPRLTRAGHQVAVVARQPRSQYALELLGWQNVRWLAADRVAEELAGTWKARMAAIEADVVIDAIAYSPEQAETIVAAFRGRISHFIHIGTIWAYGPPERVPYEESDPRKPITDYGRKKAQIEALLLQKCRQEGFPATIIHPGHICGRKWLPIDPQGSRDGTGVYRKLARGEPVVLPDRGQATIHHIHSDDIAQLCERAIERRTASLGESFSAVAPYAMSLQGCCQAVAALFGLEPALHFAPLAEMERHVSPASAAIIRDHVTHSPCCSIAKCQRLLDYQPRYTTEQIYTEAVEFMLESGTLDLSRA